MNEAIIWSPGVTLDNIERQVIFKAFSFFGKNKTQTAQALGISIRTLDNKFERYAKEDEGEREWHEKRKREQSNFLARARGIHPAQYDIANGQTSSYPQSVQNSGAANEGLRVEPAAEPAAQLEMPVPKRQEVQSVLPKHATAGGSRKNR